MSVTVNDNPTQDYAHPDNHVQLTYEMTCGFKPFTSYNNNNNHYFYYYLACHWGYYYYSASVEDIPWCCCWKVSIFTSIKEKKVMFHQKVFYTFSKSLKFCPLYIHAKLFLFPLEWLNSKEVCSFHSWKWLVNIATSRPFYGCVLSALAFDRSKAGSDLVLLQTFLFFICKWSCSRGC